MDIGTKQHLKAQQTERQELTGILMKFMRLIHKLQPQCLIGNNHHLTPFARRRFSNV